MSQIFLKNNSLRDAQIVLRITQMKKAATTTRRHEKRKTIVKSLSLPKNIVDLGIARAKSARRSFSNHVATLIEEDAASAK